MAVFLGLRPGGAAPVLVYRWGPLVLGGGSAALLLFALVWCALRRPVLQRGRTGALAVLAGSLWFCSFPLAYPSSHEDHPSQVRFRLPFSGEARVRFGGDRREANPLLFDPPRRFGFCFESPPPGAALTVLAPSPGCVERIDESRSRLTLVLEVAP
ncbi:MAG: hypothetical protein L0Y66_22805, partial [Myxococcaceae bacterium]|nr:hypothetical protein [Myxococcaceae bacterium]